LINRWYPPYTGWGGVAAYNYYLAHALKKLGHQVTVIASRWNTSTPKNENDQGVPIIRLSMPEIRYFQRLPFAGRYQRSLMQYRYSKKLSHYIHHLPNDQRPDIIEFAEVNAEGFIYLNQKDHLPVVVRCHTPTFVLKNYYLPDEMPFETSWLSKMERTCIRKADGLSAPSVDMARTIGKECPIDINQFQVISNPLDTSLFEKVAKIQQEPAKSSPVTVLFVGRLDRVKGIEVLARAIPQVLGHFPNTQFVFVGDDCPEPHGSTWQKRLTLFFEENHVQENVHFEGGIPLPDLINWYRHADIAVVPSMLYESFSYTCAQAMAAGLAVIVSRIGGIPETLGDCGYLVTPGNDHDVAGAIIELIRKPDLRFQLGNSAKQRVIRNFDGLIIANQTIQFYKKVLHLTDANGNARIEKMVS
jgi:glycosyltransferase involved in cell wall biosynthesis